MIKPEDAAATSLLADESVISLLPPHSHSIDAARFGSDAADDAVDAAHFVDDAGRGAAQELDRET